MPPSVTSRRPNVVFIMTDDHQFDALGIAGHPVVRTPVLDALARRGTRFAATSIQGSLMPAICSPSRACVLTGASPFVANDDLRSGGGAEDFVTIPPTLPTLPELLGQAGYETFITGKWHNDRASLLRSFARGERIFHGGMCDHRRVPVRNRAGVACNRPAEIGDGFSTELFCDAAVSFLRTRGDDTRPFFLWLALTSPHDPRTPPGAFRQHYVPAALPLPPAFAREPAFDNGELEVRDELLAPRPLRPEVVREHLADYYGMISHQDAEIGRVIEALRESGAAEDTIVIYVGDHGLALGRHGLLGKQNLYEHSIRVPMIMAGPGIAKDAVVDGLTHSLDLFATVLELAGLSVPPGRESRSLRPQLCDAREPARSNVFSAYRDCQRAVRAGDWKLIEYLVDGARRTELFDLQSDPHELHNRASEPALAQKVRVLREGLVAWQRSQKDTWMPLKAMGAEEETLS